MTSANRADVQSKSDGLLPFFGLAIAITWACATPAVLAWRAGEQPSEGAMGLAGLSAFGPMLAAVLVARHRGGIRSVFGPWRTSPALLVVALLTPMFLQMVARAIDLVLGGGPAAWVLLPEAPEHVAALVVFSIGEEPGWRGFAHPRMVTRFGAVRGSLLLGVGWAVWHGMFLVSPTTGKLDGLAALVLLTLPAYSVLYAWLLERGGGSLALAIAMHAGGHLDNMNRMSADELRLRVLTIVVVWIAAIFAARSLQRRAHRRRRHNEQYRPGK